MYSNMKQSDKPVRSNFDSDSVLVNYYPRVYPTSKSGMTLEEKEQEYRLSIEAPAEIKLKDFLRMGEKFKGALQQIWEIQDKKERNNMKRKKLGAATISATLYTRDSNVPLPEKTKHYNSIIALDFDGVDNLEEAKRKVSEMPYVWYVADSASRRGFFAIVPIENVDYTRHELYFRALRQEMRDLGYRIDEACKDVTRLRFVSYDPNPYLNENCTVYDLPDDFEENEANEEKRKAAAEQENPSLAKAMAYADEWEKKMVPLDDYDDWRTIAMALSGLKEDGWAILDKISKFSSSYDPEDNRKKFDDFVEHTRSIGLGSFFYKCQQYGVIPPNVPQYEMIPFPVEVFPQVVREIIRDTNKCLNFTVDHIAASLLFVASIAVGNSVIVEIKNEWMDKAILYVALVGKPGTNKTAPLKYALKPLFDRDKAELKKYEKKMAAYEAAMKQPLKERKSVPEEPEYKQIVLSDFTTEVLVRQHKINARSLAVYVDELIGFIKCFNKYRGGNDEQVWTQLYNGGSVIVNRVSSQPLNIEDTCIGVIGTIQPGLLNEFAKGKTESGFVDRWLFAFPDDTAYPKLNDAQLPKERTKEWCDIIDRIFEMPYTPGAKPFKLTRDAMKAYASWFNALADQKNNASNAFAEMATKMERYCVRFAIVLEALKSSCDKKKMKSVSLASLKGGIALCYYFIACALKARKKFSSNPLDELTEKQRKIYNDLPISFPTSEAVETALEYGMSERTMKDWLKTYFFKHVSHGQYEKRYK